MTIDHDIYYQALKTRDARFDGKFFTGVSSTGIFCRPICPAITPKPENCTFFPSADAALSAGFRPCLRCRPEAAPASPAWLGTEATVRRTVRLIEEGALDNGQAVNHLCERVGVGERQLRRLFQTHLGVSPKQIAQTRRLLFAKNLLTQTAAPITEIALAAGFNSLRRFNDAYKKSFGFAPSQERNTLKAKSHSHEGIRLRFSYRPPYDWDGLLAFFRSRAITPVELVNQDSYQRRVVIDGHQGKIIIRNEGQDNRLCCTISAIPTQHLQTVARKIRRMFDVDADPQAIANDLGRDSALRPLIDACPGIRLPGAWDSFEIAVRAVIGQQISVKGARTICTRLVERIGRGLFPEPQDILDSNLDGLGLTGRRIATLKTMAQKWPELDTAKPIQDVIDDLCALPGIGPWTAHYIVMRGCSEPDIYPVDDLGLIRTLEKLKVPATKEALRKHAERWRPWRAYGAIYLWRI